MARGNNALIGLVLCLLIVLVGLRNSNSGVAIRTSSSNPKDVEVVPAPPSPKTEASIRGAALLEEVEKAKDKVAVKHPDVPLRKPKMADGCRHVYLDFGSNIGVQVRKLFEEEKYPGAQYISRMNQVFGNQAERRRDVCVFGIEANPQHTKRLKSLEDCYNSLGWRTKFFVPNLASNTDGQSMKFYVDNDDDTLENLGATLYRNTIWKYRDDRAVEVKSIDIGSFIMNEIVDRIIPDGAGTPYIFMKLDIEGSEYLTLAGMLARGALCQVDEAAIEWHPNYMEKDYDKKQTQTVSSMLKLFQELDQPFVGCKRMKFSDVDDESYFKDGNPFPDSCNREPASGR